MIDWIQGEKFQDIADYRYAPKTRSAEDYCHLQNTLDFTKLKDGDIIYTHTCYAKQLLGILEYLNVKIYLITHNADVPVDWVPPENVLHWWGQNINIDHPKVESLPIGLENNRWYAGLRKRAKMEEMLKGTLPHSKLVYMNHSIRTNRAQRQRPYELFGEVPWMTVHHGKNGLRFDEYLYNVCDHKFMICPEGSGIDCHRFWECLYLGTIPVVKKCINSWFYNDMPVLYVNEWEEISEELLNDMWSTFKDGEWNKEKLTFTWWKNKILKDCGRS